MKIALLLGISEYNTIANLPACTSDIKLVRRILDATGVYNRVLAIYKNTTSTQIRAKIIEFVDSVSNEEIEEVFFYYTGHGSFIDGEFYFPLSDFSQNKRTQTSLSNRELDEWLRNINPKIAVKVIDACHAGVFYVKDNHNLENYLFKSVASFQKCYFLFSSTLEQSSYQDSRLSYFTRSFARAILSHQAGNIRYKDIIDFISDDFTNNPSQTPFFVTQANNTEMFSSVTPELKKVWLDFEQLVQPNEEQTFCTSTRNLQGVTNDEKRLFASCMLDSTALVDLLLQSDTMQDRYLRDDVVNALPSSISQTIQRRTSLKADIRNIVRACLNYKDGIESLVKVIEEQFEGRSITVLQLQRLIDSKSNNG